MSFLLLLPGHMKHIKYSFYLLLLLCIILQSCKTGKQQYGKRVIKKDTDTITLKNTTANIRNIPNDLFKEGSYNGKENIQIKYRLYSGGISPKDKDKYPLVVVFHGSGAIGNDNKSQLGLMAKLWATQDISSAYPAYVLAPQFPSRSSNYRLDSSRNVLVSKPADCLYTALQLIDSIKAVLPIDQQRIYLVGFSMGGSTVINALTARPGLFAAAVSIAGIPQFDSIQSISHIPLWLMHGDMDTENSPKSNEQFYREAGINNKTRFWMFEQTAHEDIFSTVLLGKNIPEWLFSKKKK